MPLIHNHPQSPAQGHNFPDPSGHILRADSIASLIVAVASYRRNNGYPVGNPEAEVEAFYAEHFPWLISKVGETAASTPTPHDNIARWLNLLLRDPPRAWAEHDEGTDRMAVCRACPHFREAPVLHSENLRRFLILGGGRLSKAEGYCAVHEFVCNMAALILKPETQKSERSCWIKGDSP